MDAVTRTRHLSLGRWAEIIESVRETPRPALTETRRHWADASVQVRGDFASLCDAAAAVEHYLTDYPVEAYATDLHTHANGLRVIVEGTRLASCE